MVPTHWKICTWIPRKFDSSSFIPLIYNYRSSSRGLRNNEKKPERGRKDSTASIQHEPERPRKDSNASIQHEIIYSGLKQRDRERRDSHKSNRSSTIGNSRDDLDRWRSLRSYSREQSTEGLVVVLLLLIFKWFYLAWLIYSILWRFFNHF